MREVKFEVEERVGKGVGAVFVQRPELRSDEEGRRRKEGQSEAQIPNIGSEFR